MNSKDSARLRAAEAFDAWRVVPRLLMAGYAWTVWQVTAWFMTLPEPTTQQSAFVGLVWGAAAGVFGMYVNSSRRWPDD